jgi:flavin reductase (DIM6/NTAB) family NADH-FMN oxidoreductase RutF
MRQLKLSKAFTLMESGPVVLVTTHDGRKDNIMAISWTMVLDFTPVFAITTGEWNHSFAALRKNRECKVIDIVKRHNIVVLEAVAAYIDTARKEKRTVHAVGDGTFIVDGRKIDRRKMMASKIPYGV